MPSLAAYKKTVGRMEKGKLPPGFPSLAEARIFLIGELCRGPWETPEERSQAQSLVARLDRMGRQPTQASPESG